MPSTGRSKSRWRDWSQADRWKLLQQLRKTQPASKTGCYPGDPVAYVREVLKGNLWDVQQEITRKLREPPYKVLVKASHSVGKTHLAACLTNWWFDTFDPSCVITTAPTHRDVCDLLWREVRILRGDRGGFVGSSAPELRSGPNRYAKGFTASKGESFQGRHQERMLFLFDEAVGVAPIFFETTRSMFKPDGLHGWVCLFNPTDSSSQVADEERRGGWHVITMSALDHPNVKAELEGKDPPYPAAVSLAQVNDWLTQWAEPIDPADRTVTDIEWPPGSGKWIRPGPLAESRVLGRWPSQAAYAIWSDSLWQSVLATRHEIQPHWKVQLGCDVARFGDDMTAISLRKGLCLLHFETHNGWSLDRTAGRLKQLAHEYADERNPRKTIPVLIDVGGVGAGVVDMREDWNFIGVDSSALGRQPERYYHTRSELWFASQECAKKGLLDVSRISEKDRQELGRQLLAPTYAVDSAGRLRVEDKDMTKKRLKRSPDSADSFNMCYYAYSAPIEQVAGHMG